jgi:hypothetical protein
MVSFVVGVSAWLSEPAKKILREYGCNVP